PDVPGPTDPAGAADLAATNPRYGQRLKSFVKRGGRTTDGQQRAYDELGPTYLLPYRAAPLDFAATFGREAPTVLEIGFG
ncbi:tRNA (guanosine(46)-N7)-methyltransferase TrmB, partial [Rhizobium johnstonii]